MKNKIEKQRTVNGRLRYRVRSMYKNKRYSKTFRLKQEALDYVMILDRYGMQKVLDMEQDKQTSTVSGAITADELIVLYADTLTNVTNSHKTHVLGIKNRLYNLSNKPISMISKQDVKEWVIKLQNENLKPKTIQNIHGTLSAMFSYGVNENYLSQNPCVKIRLPKAVREEVQILSKVEYNRFLDLIDPFYTLFIKTLFVTGLRFGEITSLYKENLDVKECLLTVNKAWGDNNSVLKTPKTNKGIRKIALPKKLANDIKDTLCDKQDTDFIFTDKNGDRIKHEHFRVKIWLPAVRAFGRKIRVHDARHSCASWLLSARIPLHVVSDHLGHENIQTTVKRYGHLLPENRQAVSIALEDVAYSFTSYT
jgi:integrase